MGFVQTKFVGYDNEGLLRFYKTEFQKAKKLGYSDQQAHEHAKFMVEWYGHQFRKYEPTNQPVKSRTRKPKKARQKASK